MDYNNNKIFLSSKPYTKREEKMNILTHLTGAVLVCLGSVYLITLSIITGSAIKIIAISIYSFSMIALYCASTLYHSAKDESAKRKLKVIDHASIYLLIAGTYTPFLLINLKGAIGITLFIIVWSMAFLGITAEIFFLNKYKKISLTAYLVMGWLIVFALKPLFDSTSMAGLILIASGGLFYSFGVYFYVRKDKEFYHAVWHVFVLFGTITHFFAVLYGSLLPIN